MSFYQNYIKQCIDKGVSPSKAAEKAGTTKTSVHRWKSGSLPSDATVAKLAAYFMCSVDDLMEDKKTPATESDGLTELQREVIRLVSESLSDQDVSVLLSTAKALIDTHKSHGDS